MNKICPYCYLKMKKERLSTDTIYVCRNEYCIYRIQSEEDKTCKLYAETINGQRFEFKCYTHYILPGNDGMPL